MNTVLNAICMMVLAMTSTAIAADGGISAKDRAAVVELLKKHDAAVNAGDAAALYALATDDYVELPAGGPALIGKDAARKPLEDFFRQFQLTVRSNIQEIEVAGKWAWVRTDTSIKRTPKSGEPQDQTLGKNIFILHRQADGGWKMKTNMWSNSGPFEAVK